MEIADVFGIVGTACFLLAEIKQLYKLLTSESVAGVSLTHYKFKLFAAVNTSIAFALTGLWCSFAVLTLQTVTINWGMWIVLKKRRKR
jgi:hypothetical protein